MLTFVSLSALKLIAFVVLSHCGVLCRFGSSLDSLEANDYPARERRASTLFRRSRFWSNDYFSAKSAEGRSIAYFQVYDLYATRDNFVIDANGELVKEKVLSSFRTVVVSFAL